MSKIITLTWWTGSWKTSITNAVVELFWKDITKISHDDYYKDIADIPKKLQMILNGKKIYNFDHPDALHTDMFEKHLEKLLSWKEVKIPKYIFWKWPILEAQTKKPNKIIFIEWLFPLVSKKICELSNFNIFVKVDEVHLLARKIKREFWEDKTRDDVMNLWLSDTIDYYMNFIRDWYKKYVEPSEKLAHLVVNNNDLVKKWETPKMVEIVINELKNRYDLILENM